MDVYSIAYFHNVLLSDGHATTIEEVDMADVEERPPGPLQPQANFSLRG